MFSNIIKLNNIKDYTPNNFTTNKEFVEICKRPQASLKRYLVGKLKETYENVLIGDGYIFTKGDIPILLTAHMDTVHEVTVREFHEEDGILKSPQGIGGDDRCGIYMILKLIEKGFKPYIVFCEDEEIGGVGSNKFVRTELIEELKDCKYFIELDRANSEDAVYYDCGNKEFKEFISEVTGYKEAYGSFSDISHLSPACDRASVNLSCGYYKAHTTDEYVVLSEMENTINKVAELLSIDYTEMETFDYQDDFLNYGSLYDDFYGYSGYSGEGEYEIDFINENKTSDIETVEARSYEEAVGVFLIAHPNLTYQHIIDCYIIDDFSDCDYLFDKEV